jgi:hypothetical protein
MKIALTGSVGTGKTTLAKALAESLHLPFLEEDFTGVIKAVETLRHEQKQAGGQSSDAQRAYVEAGLTWLRKRGAAQAAHEGFVADRFAFDLLARWIVAGVGAADNEWFLKLLAECRRQGNALDLIVMPPLVIGNAGAVAATAALGPNEAGLRRREKISDRVLLHSVTRGLMDQFLRTPKLHLPRSADTPEKRVALVMKALRSLGRGPAAS